MSEETASYFKDLRIILNCLELDLRQLENNLNAILVENDALRAELATLRRDNEELRIL